MNPQSENIKPPVDSEGNSTEPQPPVDSEDNSPEPQPPLDSENDSTDPQPPLDSADNSPDPPPEEDQLAAEIKHDVSPEDSPASKIKQFPFPPMIKDDPLPDIHTDDKPQHKHEYKPEHEPHYETVIHNGVQPDHIEYPIDAPVSSPLSEKAPSKERIRSIDALRGFDMFWIVGGNALLLHLAKLFDWPWANWVTTQLEHGKWGEFTFYDLIFPLFLFLAGVSMPISLGRKLEHGASKASLLGKVSIRAILLVLLGIIYNGGLDLKPLAETRLFSVLGFIGISYFIAALIFIYSDVKHRFMWVIGLLAGYYAALMFTHVPGHGSGVLTPEGVFTGYIDRTWVAWKIYTPHFDPEGLFLPVAGAVVAIVGSLTGSFLVSCSWNKFIKAIMLGVSGVAFYFAAQLLEPHMIIAKSFWSPTFVILCLGWSLMLLAAFYLIMDAIGFWQWAFFFSVIGMNSITIYLGLKLFNFTQTSNFLFGGTIDHFFKAEYQPLLTSIAFILTWWGILFFMYRKKIFLRV